MANFLQTHNAGTIQLLTMRLRLIPTALLLRGPAKCLLELLVAMEEPDSSYWNNNSITMEYLEIIGKTRGILHFFDPKVADILDEDLEETYLWAKSKGFTKVSFIHENSV